LKLSMSYAIPDNLVDTDSPLLIYPELAELLWFNEAIVFNQIHYWLKLYQEDKSHIHKERVWIYNSYENWKTNFPRWSTSTIRRAINKLEKQWYIMSWNFNKMKMDKTKWYTIDFAIYRQKLQAHKRTSNIANWKNESNLMSEAIPKTTSQTTSENNNYSSSEDDVYIPNQFYLDNSRDLNEDVDSTQSDYQRITRIFDNKMSVLNISKACRKIKEICDEYGFEYDFSKRSISFVHCKRYDGIMDKIVSEVNSREWDSFLDVIEGWRLVVTRQ